MNRPKIAGALCAFALFVWIAAVAVVSVRIGWTIVPIVAGSIAAVILHREIGRGIVRVLRVFRGTPQVPAVVPVSEPTQIGSTVLPAPASSRRAA